MKRFDGRLQRQQPAQSVSKRLFETLELFIR
ncbi:hypothetical protein P3T25_001873 [Paraburkholderia sp. GAS32]